MFAQLFERQNTQQIDEIDDILYIAYNATLKPEYRVGPFTEKFTGDWNVNLEDLTIELIDDDTISPSSIVGSLSFTLTPIIPTTS